MEYKIENFPDNGFASLDLKTEQSRFTDIVKDIKSKRNFDQSLFLEEADFKEKIIGSNPTKGGFNLAETINLDFVEKNPIFLDAMEQVLGKEYEILLKKFVMGVPESIVPNWVLEHTKNQMVANLGPYVKPEYRDITYLKGS